MNKILSVIIVNFRSREKLEKSLFSLMEKIAGQIDFEVIIVNNDKEENLGELAEICENTVIIDCKNNAGFGSGINLGAEKAEGEILWFLNPDSQIISGDIEEIIREIKKNEVGALGIKMVDGQGNIQPWICGFEINFKNLILNNLGFSTSKKIWESRKKLLCDWVSGGAFFIKRHLFLELGGFDKNFFMYFEDVDLCRRIKDCGYNIMYYPEFFILHDGGSSYKKKKLQKKHYYKSQDYYFRKHFGFKIATLVKLLRIFLLHSC